MKKKGGLHSYVVLSFLAVGPFALLTAVSYFVWNSRPKSILVSCNNFYSDQLEREVRLAAEKGIASFDKGPISPSEIYKNLKSQFKVIKRMVWKHDSSGQGLLEIEGDKPLFLVGNRYVVGEKKRLYPIEFFEKCEKEKLDHLTICEKSFIAVEDGGKKLASMTNDFLRKIPKDYFEKYTIDYKGANHIVLNKSLGKKKLSFVLNEKLFFDEKRIQAAQSIDERGGISSRYKNIVYDMRFNNRICARGLKRVGDSGRVECPEKC